MYHDCAAATLKSLRKKSEKKIGRGCGSASASTFMRQRKVRCDGLDLSQQH